MNKATRVKYKMEGNVFRTTNKFPANEGVLLQVTIDPHTNLVQVIKLGDAGEELVEAVTEVNFSKAKTTAKVLLKKYGVNFLEEVRRKKVE